MHRETICAVDAIGDDEGATVAKEWEKVAALQAALDIEATSELSPEEIERRARTTAVALPAIAEGGAKASNPFPALEIMKIGMKAEEFQMNTRFQKAKRLGHEYSGNIDLLLKLSAQINGLSSDAPSHPLTEEMKKHLLSLREKGIDILPGELNGKELKKEDLLSTKSQIGYHIDVQRTKVQQLFSSDISIAVQFIQTLGEMMKAIARNHEKEGALYTRNQISSR